MATTTIINDNTINPNIGLINTELNTYPTWTKAFIKESIHKVRVLNMKNSNILGKIVSSEGVIGDFYAKDMTLYSHLTDFKTQLDLGGLDQTELEKLSLQKVNADIYNATNGQIYGPIITSGSLSDRIKNAQILLQRKKLNNMYVIALNPEIESKLTLNSLGQLAKNACLLIGGSSEIHVGTSTGIKPESKGYKILKSKPIEEVCTALDETLVNNIKSSPKEAWIGGSWAYLFRVPKNRLKSTDEASALLKKHATETDSTLTKILKEIPGFGEKIVSGSYFRFTRENVIMILITILNNKNFCALPCNELTVFNAKCVLHILTKLDAVKYICVGWDGKTT
jgi:hypothetical protein